MKSKIDKNKKLRELRLYYGLSQKKFGNKLGLTREAIASYENNNNPVPTSAILKMKQITGIGKEYFETDISLQEALEKYQITPVDIVNIDDFDETSCFIYEGIESYVKNNFLEKKGDFSLKLQLLTLLFGFNQMVDYHFIKLNNAANEPFARRGDILIVVKEAKASNGDYVITYFQQSYIIFQYFIAGIDEVLFKGNNGVEIKLSGKEREQITILGIIKQKITPSM